MKEQLKIVLRRNTDGSIDALPIGEAVSVLSALLSAETYDSRLAAELVRGRVFNVNGCRYQYAPKLRMPGRSVPR